MALACFGKPLFLGGLRSCFRWQAKAKFRAPVFHQLGGHVRHGQRPIHHPRADRCLGHAVVLRFGRVLSHGQPTALLDAFDADGTIPIRT